MKNTQQQNKDQNKPEVQKQATPVEQVKQVAAPEVPKQTAPEIQKQTAPEVPKQAAPEVPKEEMPVVVLGAQVIDPNQKQEETFEKSLKLIRSLIPADFEAKQNKSGVTYFGGGRTRLLKIVEAKRGLRIEFNVPVTQVSGLTILTEEEAKEKHMGTCRWIYSGNDMAVVQGLVKEAITKFEPKKRADAKEEKDKKEESKVVAAPQAEKSGAVVTRQLTDEEKAKLGMTKSDEQKEKESMRNVAAGQ